LSSPGPAAAGVVGRTPRIHASPSRGAQNRHSIKQAYLTAARFACRDRCALPHLNPPCRRGPPPPPGRHRCAGQTACARGLPSLGGHPSLQGADARNTGQPKLPCLHPCRPGPHPAVTWAFRPRRRGRTWVALTVARPPLAASYTGATPPPAPHGGRLAPRWQPQVRPARRPARERRNPMSSSTHCVCLSEPCSCSCAGCLQLIGSACRPGGCGKCCGCCESRFRCSRGCCYGRRPASARFSRMLASQVFTLTTRSDGELGWRITQSSIARIRQKRALLRALQSHLDSCDKSMHLSNCPYYRQLAIALKFLNRSEPQETAA
jgi:hypothetical protein